MPRVLARARLTRKRPPCLASRSAYFAPMRAVFFFALLSLACAPFARAEPPTRAETLALAAKLARGPAFALAMTKEMLNREMNLGLETALEWEAQAQAICLQHPDFREAYQSFIEKREPKFK